MQSALSALFGRFDPFPENVPGEARVATELYRRFFNAELLGDPSCFGAMRETTKTCNRVSTVLFANLASISMNAAIGGAAQLRLDHAPERVSTAEPGSGLDVNVFHSCLFTLCLHFI